MSALSEYSPQKTELPQLSSYSFLFIIYALFDQVNALVHVTLLLTNWHFDGSRFLELDGSRHLEHDGKMVPGTRDTMVPGYWGTMVQAPEARWFTMGHLGHEHTIGAFFKNL